MALLSWQELRREPALLLCLEAQALRRPAVLRVALRLLAFLLDRGSTAVDPDALPGSPARDDALPLLQEVGLPDQSLPLSPPFPLPRGAAMEIYALGADEVCGTAAGGGGALSAGAVPPGSRRLTRRPATARVPRPQVVRLSLCGTPRARLRPGGRVGRGAGLASRLAKDWPGLEWSGLTVIGSKDFFYPLLPSSLSLHPRRPTSCPSPLRLSCRGGLTD